MSGAVGKHRPDLSTDDFVRRYQAGESSDSIAAYFGCTKSTVLTRLRSAGVGPRATGTHAKPRGPASPYWKGGRILTDRGTGV
jgi:hypothetical protein